ncbi:maleylacetoacetate isomerase [Pseudomonas sp. MWU13-2105]|uniref:maleylacetoacetate isomerase n=1 Tax=Pseudomonas sp. MWU13-2105 TaxID=2935074 RepID=UPI00200D6CF3|nr:maleylacetoacetate isomerase [Pseudomonas sp. MWU13-2105]
MIRLHGFYRSSATYRVRIALNLKALDYVSVEHDLTQGEHRLAPYLRLNPQGLVPALEIDGGVLTQSQAIIEYLDEVYPGVPLLPSTPRDRARVRALYQLIAADTHHVTAMRVGAYLRTQQGANEQQVREWQHHWLSESFSALEALLDSGGPAARFAHGNQPTLADIALVPQVYAARRLNLAIEPWPNLSRVVENALAEPAFIRAHPDNHAVPAQSLEALT